MVLNVEHVKIAFTLFKLSLHFQHNTIVHNPALHNTILCHLLFITLACDIQSETYVMTLLCEGLLAKPTCKRRGKLTRITNIYFQKIQEFLFSQKNTTHAFSKCVTFFSISFHSFDGASFFPGVHGLPPGRLSERFEEKQ